MYQALVQLATNKKTLIFAGDSVTTQNYQAAKCEIYRESHVTHHMDVSISQPKYCGAFNVSVVDTGKNKELVTEVSCLMIPHTKVVMKTQGKNKVKSKFHPMQQIDKAINDSIRLGFTGAVIVTNIGLHYNDMSELKIHMNTYMEYLKGLLAKWENLTILWREQTAQHFYSSNDGQFQRRFKGDYKKRTCLAHRDPGVDSRTKISNQVFKQVFGSLEITQTGARNSYIGYIPFYGVTKVLSSMHTRKGDCTHYCYHPSLWQPIWKALAETSSLIHLNRKH